MIVYLFGAILLTGVLELVVRAITRILPGVSETSLVGFLFRELVSQFIPETVVVRGTIPVAFILVVGIAFVLLILYDR